MSIIYLDFTSHMPCISRCGEAMCLRDLGIFALGNMRMVFAQYFLEISLFIA